MALAFFYFESMAFCYLVALKNPAVPSAIIDKCNRLRTFRTRLFTMLGYNRLFAKAVLPINWA